MAQKYGLDVALVKAVVHAESSFNPRATSSKGARGLMQLMPGTASRYGVANVTDPYQNLEGGARYLRDLLDQFDQLSLAQHGVSKVEAGKLDLLGMSMLSA